MKFQFILLNLCFSLASLLYCDAYIAKPIISVNNQCVKYGHSLKLSASTIEPPTTAPLGNIGVPEKAKIPLTKDSFKSEKNIDYVPLATMLMTGDFEAADQFTRDLLITLAGEGAQKKGYVYYSDVKKIPITDLQTLENLWLKYSKGQFGYSVQKELWESPKVMQDFEKFCRLIGWNKMDNGMERKLRWFGKSEFIYDLKSAPKGHLPLTSALRGTTLFKNLMIHPAWDNFVPDKHDD